MMTGKIYISDQVLRIGKIVFEDGSESKIMQFPPNYESGDIAYVKYVNNDPDKPVISLSAESPTLHYGSLLVPKLGEKPRPSLIVNYPLPLGLIKYSMDKVNFPIDQKNREVCFRIAKDSGGRLLAFDVVQASEPDRFKCNPPKYGLITSVVISAQEGYIVAVHDKIEDTGVRSGVIDRIVTQTVNSNSVEMGYIKCGKVGEEAYFQLNLYQWKFKRRPVIGEEVFFSSTKDFYSGNRVERFYQSTAKQRLIGKQSIDVVLANKNYRISMNEYLKVSKRQPKPGDIITAFLSVDGPVLTLSANEPITKLIFHQYSLMGETCPKDINQDLCQDFTEPNPKDLYKALVDNNGNVFRLLRVDLNCLPEAISCYKSDCWSKEHILIAIETLIRHRFSDKNIHLWGLIREREQILKILVNESLAAKRFDEAINYELRLQDLQYNPKDLGKFKEMPACADTILTEVSYPDASVNQTNWDIDPELHATEAQASAYDCDWNIETQASGQEIVVARAYSNWLLDLTEYSIGRTPTNPEIYYNIDI